MASQDDAPASRTRQSLVPVLAATAVSAASSFVILLIVAPALGPTGYASFSVYWAALFMVVGVLFGVQQETTRAVSNQEDVRVVRRVRASLVRFAGVVAAVVLVLAMAAGILSADPLFGAGNTDWAYPLAIAVASYVGVAALNGILAGREQWTWFALVPLIDGVLRLVLVAVVLGVGADGTALAWAVAVPFPVSLLFVAVLAWPVVRAGSGVRESYRQLTLNSGRTVAASAANAVLVNGFPVVLSFFAGDERAALGAVVLALTLTRAPILVPLTALQSMLIARFSASPEQARRLMLLALGALGAITPAIALPAWLWGQAVLGWLFGDGFAVDGALLALLVVASGCLGLLTVTGARVLASGRHTVFAGGWILACVLAIAVVAFAPGGIGMRTVLGLIIGPLIGAAWHLTLRRRR